MISIKQLSKKYGQKQVLNNISFEIQQGELYGLVGPNGVGKTTLLSILINLIQADSGSVMVANQHNNDKDYLKRIGFMQDNTVLYPHLSGYDHLAYVAFAHGIDNEEIEKVSLKVGNYAYLNQKVGNYSLGMKQHLLFACAILHRPSVLLLDEPFNGLDPTSLIRIRELIIELNTQGTTVLVSSLPVTLLSISNMGTPAWWQSFRTCVIYSALINRLSSAIFDIFAVSPID